MQTAQLSPELADTAGVLNDRHHQQLLRFAQLMAPHINSLDRKFHARLQTLGFDARQRRALAAITPGAAARTLAGGCAPLNFIEQVEYNGRRLAKLNLPPSAILEALKEYDRALAPNVPQSGQAA